jgi:aminoglycoside/choline kinase family phosphotransferase
LRAKVPACFYNGADPAAGRWALLLEDCGPGVPTDQVAGASLDQARAAVVELGRFHANWLGQPRPAEWLPGFDRGPMTGLQDVVASAVPSFVDRYGERLPAATVDWLRAFAPNLAGWAAVEATHPLTVVHADYRLDNLIFTVDGTMTILDWQTALVGHGAMDLCSFLVTSLSVDHRRDWERELIAIYAELVGSTPDEVLERFRSHLLWWMALYANNLSQIEPGDDRGRALFEQMVVGTFTAAVDHEVGRLL